MEQAVALLEQLIAQMEETIAAKKPLLENKSVGAEEAEAAPPAARPGGPGKPTPAQAQAPNPHVSKKSAGKPAGGACVSGNENQNNFAKSLMMVALVKEIEAHPLSEKLYLCKVEVAPGEVCQVVTGLQKFYKVEDLVQRKVVVIRNLKPAKLASSLSEAMILAGSVHLPDGGETVKILDPPATAEVGDRVFLEGEARCESPAKQLNSKSWDKIVALLKVQDGKATFDGRALVCSAGHVLVPDLPDGAEIH